MRSGCEVGRAGAQRRKEKKSKESSIRKEAKQEKKKKKVKKKKRKKRKRGRIKQHQANLTVKPLTWKESQSSSVIAGAHPGCEIGSLRKRRRLAASPRRERQAETNQRERQGERRKTQKTKNGKRLCAFDDQSKWAIATEAIEETGTIGQLEQLHFVTLANFVTGASEAIL